MGSRSITLKHTTRQEYLSPKSCIHNLFFHVVLIFVNKGQVALKSIIDQVSDLAIERQLICFLPSLFTAEIVYDLTDDQVFALAAEDEQAAEERIRCSELLSALHASMVELKPLQGHRTVAYKGVDSSKRPLCYSSSSIPVLSSVFQIFQRWGIQNFVAST